MPPKFVDDKSAIVVPFILQLLKQHTTKTPFFIGLNGVQGAGKTTLVTALLDQLRSQSLQPLAFSIDDLYLPHAQLSSLASSNPRNPLLQQRGQPGTHDIDLGSQIFSALKRNQTNIRIPSYDKSAHAGQGDRAPEETWLTVNKPDEKPIDVVLFEGWCVGFKSLSSEQLAAKYSEAVAAISHDSLADQVRSTGRLGKQVVDNLQVINQSLRQYDELTNQFDAFVYIDAEDTQYVYDWRSEQEAELRRVKGSGMTEEQVIKFVNGYYPSYELYADVLRTGVFPPGSGKQLHLRVG